MHDKRRPLTGEMLRHIIWSNGGKFILLTAMMWGLVLAAIVSKRFGFEIRAGRFGTGSVLTVGVALIMASVVSFATLVIVVPILVRAIRLAKVGEQVLGTIRRRLGVTWRSTETVQISYTFEGSAHAMKAPLGRHSDSIGTQVQLIVDPASPKRCMLREHVFPPGFDIDA